MLQLLSVVRAIRKCELNIFLYIQSHIVSDTLVTIDRVCNKGKKFQLIRHVHTIICGSNAVLT